MNERQSSEDCSFRLTMRPGDRAASLVPEREARIADRLARDVVAAADYWLSPGVTIVLSTDVTNERFVKPGVLGKWAAKKWASLVNKWHRNRMIDEEMKRQMAEKGVLQSGWSVGNMFRGHYRSEETGDDYDEDSLAVEVRGVSKEFGEDLAEELAKKFRQESVLLIDNETGRAALVES